MSFTHSPRCAMFCRCRNASPCASCRAIDRTSNPGSGPADSNRKHKSPPVASSKTNARRLGEISATSMAVARSGWERRSSSGMPQGEVITLVGSLTAYCGPCFSAT